MNIKPLQNFYPPLSYILELKDKSNKVYQHRSPCFCHPPILVHPQLLLSSCYSTVCVLSSPSLRPAYILLILFLSTVLSVLLLCLGPSSIRPNIKILKEPIRDRNLKTEIFKGTEPIHQVQISEGNRTEPENRPQICKGTEPNRIFKLKYEGVPNRIFNYEIFL